MHVCADGVLRAAHRIASMGAPAHGMPSKRAPADPALSAVCCCGLRQAAVDDPRQNMVLIEDLDSHAIVAERSSALFRTRP